MIVEDSLALRALNSLVTIIEGITTDNGFATDVKDVHIRAHRWVSARNMPVVCVLYVSGAETTRSPGNCSESSELFRIMAKFIDQGNTDAEVSKQALNFLNDLKHAIYKGNPRLRDADGDVATLVNISNYITDEGLMDPGCFFQVDVEVRLDECYA